MRIYFTSYLGCWKNSISCGLWLRSLFPCWLWTESYSQLLEVARSLCIVNLFISNPAKVDQVPLILLIFPASISSATFLTHSLPSSFIFKLLYDYVWTTKITLRNNNLRNDNTEKLHLNIFNLITLTKLYLPYKVTHIHKFSGLGSRTEWALFYLNTKGTINSEILFIFLKIWIHICLIT